MTRDEFDRFCAGLPHTHRVVQWGGAHVWKVATKVFAIGGWNEGRFLYVTFKASPASFEILSRLPGLRPAPYLASRGLKWIQRTSRETLSDADLRRYLCESHRLAAAGLTKKRQRELGLATIDPVSR
jgi:predicted DNA-binding protein (MmcQ/YjbR family)